MAEQSVASGHSLPFLLFSTPFIYVPRLLKEKKGRSRGAPPSSRLSRGGGETRHCHTLVRVNAE